MNVFARNTVAAMALIFAVSANATSKTELLQMCASEVNAQAAVTEVMGEIGLSANLQNESSEISQIAANLKNATPAQLASLQKKLSAVSMMMGVLKNSALNAEVKVTQKHGKVALISVMTKAATMTAEFVGVLIDSAKVAISYKSQNKEIPASVLADFKARGEKIATQIADLQTSASEASMGDTNTANQAAALSAFQTQLNIEACKLTVNAIRK